ncbi:conserved hypothetical protein [Ricinus communis]|uniref:Plant thionin family protein n=1 Tax=Ricinus communis TaxID=3988 RepID=B9SQH8_RICCO|nr:conserved hypothetical protein [Ricinus communis]
MTASKVSIGAILIVMLVVSIEVAEGWKLESYTAPTTESHETCFKPCFESCIPHKPKFICKTDCEASCAYRRS